MSIMNDSLAFYMNNHRASTKSMDHCFKCCTNLVLAFDMEVDFTLSIKRLEYIYKLERELCICPHLTIFRNWKIPLIPTCVAQLN